MYGGAGLDANGVPAFRFGPDSMIPVRQRIVSSAYDYAKTEDLGSQSETAVAPNGDYVATFQFGHGPRGMGLSNSGGIDAARFDRKGVMKWLRPLNDFGPIQGIKVSEKFILSSWGHQAEWFGMDPNGLSLGHLGYPAEAGWEGYWIDHPTQYFMFRGNDDRLHVLAGDYMQNCQHWLSLENYDNYRSSAAPVRVTAAKARELSFRPAAVVQLSCQAGPAADCRAETCRADADRRQTGQVARHHPPDCNHPHDQHERQQSQGRQRRGPPGLSRPRLVRAGPAIRRRGLFPPAQQQESPPRHGRNGDQRLFRGIPVQHLAVHRHGSRHHSAKVLLRQARKEAFGRLCPRSIEVLPNARDVSERQLIESIYGEDMSDCKVIVTEFKLPIDKTTYEGAEDSIFPVRSGNGMWIGMAIDDNDVPGSDTQKMLVWPATYNTFGVKEVGAYAVFE